MIEDIRAFAKSWLIVGAPQTRPEYVAAVRTYAVEKHGNKTDVAMHAERTARHLWDSQR